MADASLAVHDNRAPQLTTHTGLRLREDVLYSNAKGEEKAGIRKRADQALEQLKDLLTKLLQTDETILYVANAQVYPPFLERFFAGWHYYVRPRVLLVFTNRRLLALRTRSQGLGSWKWDRGIRSLCWGDVETAKVKGGLSRILKFKLCNGTKVQFWRIRRVDTKKIEVLVGFLAPASAGEASAVQGFVSLCPSCLAALVPGAYTCAQCRTAFKDEKMLLRRTVLIPGGAYFYVGWTGLGILNLLGEGLLLVVLIAIFVESFASGPIRGAQHGPVSAEVAAGPTILLLLLAIEKAVAWAHSRSYVRDFIPVE